MWIPSWPADLSLYLCVAISFTLTFSSRTHSKPGSQLPPCGTLGHRGLQSLEKYKEATGLRRPDEWQSVTEAGVGTHYTSCSFSNTSLPSHTTSSLQQNKLGNFEMQTFPGQIYINTSPAISDYLRGRIGQKFGDLTRWRVMGAEDESRGSQSKE